MGSGTFVLSSFPMYGTINGSFNQSIDGRRVIRNDTASSRLLVNKSKHPRLFGITLWT